MWLLVDLGKFLESFANVREDRRSRVGTFTTITVVCTAPYGVFFHLESTLETAIPVVQEYLLS